MTNGETTDVCNLSKRQVQRMKKKVAQNGPCGLIHGNRGRPSSRVLPWKDHVISLVKEKYSDFNFSHLAETLEEEEHLLVSRETLRLWLRPLGYQGKIRKQPHHRKRRRRSEQERRMLGFAGSPQTRGRGERINQTFQDQLVSELRLHTITTAEAATQ